jgi:hypothetical protein
MSTVPQVVTAAISAPTTGMGAAEWLSTQKFVSESTDTPANTVFEPRLTGRVTYTRKVSCVLWDRSNADASIGYIEINNTDGSLDYWFSQTWRDRTVVLKRGLATVAYNDHDTVVRAIIDGILSPDWHTIRLVLRDKSALLDVPLQTQLYNALPFAPGLEGTPRPVCFGDCFGVPLTLVDAALLDYEVNDGPYVTIDQVTDQGVVLTENNQWTESPESGVFGVRRLTNPAGKQVCQVRGTGTGSVVIENLDDVIDFLLARTEVPLTDVNHYSVDALQAAANYQLAYWGRDSATVAQVMTMVMDSFCGWWYFDRLGELRVDRLKTPVATPAVELNSINLIGDIRIQLDTAQGLSDGIGVRKNWSPHSESEIALSLLVIGATDLPDAERLRQPFTVIRGVNTLHPTYSASVGADPIPTLISNSTDGTSEINRITELFEQENYFYFCAAAIEGALAYELEPGETALLEFDRFGLTEGKTLLVTEVETDLLSSVVKLKLWGPGPNYGDF